MSEIKEQILCLVCGGPYLSLGGLGRHVQVAHPTTWCQIPNSRKAHSFLAHLTKIAARMKTVNTVEVGR